MKTMTLSPIKNVDAEQLERLQKRAPIASTALIVATALSVLDNMDDAKLQKALTEQAKREQKLTL